MASDARAVTPAEEAAEAIAATEGAERAECALAAVMPDGRTIAEWLDADVVHVGDAIDRVVADLDP